MYIINTVSFDQLNASSLNKSDMFSDMLCLTGEDDGIEAGFAPQLHEVHHIPKAQGRVTGEHHTRLPELTAEISMDAGVMLQFIGLNQLQKANAWQSVNDIQLCVSTGLRSDDLAEFGSYLCVRKRWLGQIDLRLLVLTQPSTQTHKTAREWAFIEHVCGNITAIMNNHHGNHSICQHIIKPVNFSDASSDYDKKKTF